MPIQDPRIDAYIEKKAEFARPILLHLRKIVHEACPEVQETIKWGMPFFEYKGPLCHFAAFKAHAVFSFWKGSIMDDPDGILEETGKTAMGHLGRITSLAELPDPAVLIRYIREAMRLNDEGIALPKKAASKEETEAPEDLRGALGEVPAALSTFENFSPSNKRDYVEWITEAKTEATRQKRLKQAVEWMAEGKPRNWKYMKKK